MYVHIMPHSFHEYQQAEDKRSQVQDRINFSKPYNNQFTLHDQAIVCKRPKY